VLEHAVTFVKLPLRILLKNGMAEEDQLLGNVGEMRCDRRSGIQETGVTEAVTVIKHRETAGEWKHDPL
jgi:hypothetical protein